MALPESASRHVLLPSLYFQDWGRPRRPTPHQPTGTPGRHDSHLYRTAEVRRTLHAPPPPLTGRRVAGGRAGRRHHPAWSAARPTGRDRAGHRPRLDTEFHHCLRGGGRARPPEWLHGAARQHTTDDTAPGVVRWRSSVGFGLGHLSAFVAVQSAAQAFLPCPVKPADPDVPADHGQHEATGET